MPPPPPPRKTMTQLESDEAYARQLAEQYDSTYSGFGTRGYGDPPMPRGQRQASLKPNELYDDKEHSFIDGKRIRLHWISLTHEDDLPVIKQNLAKGFADTKDTINKWIKDFQKRIDGDDSDDPIPRPGGPSNQRQNFGPSTSSQLHGIRKTADANRQSGDKDRYDADPQVLGDDFGHRLELRDDDCK
jgi:hypothetical protein